MGSTELNLKHQSIAFISLILAALYEHTQTRETTLSVVRTNDIDYRL